MLHRGIVCFASDRQESGRSANPRFAYQPLSLFSGVILSLRRDAVWTAADIFITSGLGFLFRLLVAKLLVPEQFGLVVMVLAVVALIQVVNEFGFTAALVQKEEAKLAPALVNTTFTASLIVSIAATLATAFVVAPLAARFYGQPNAEPLLMAMALVLLTAPFSTVSAAVLYRERRFRSLAVNRAVSTLVSMGIAGLILSVRPDPWVVVWQVLIAAVLSTIGLVVLSRWRFRLRLDPVYLRDVLGFSGFVLVSDVMGQVNGNLGVFVIGRLLPVSDVGLFGLAVYFTESVRRMVMSILNRVTFVHFSSVQSDPDALRRTYFSAVTWNCRLLFPVMVGMMCFGPALLVAFLGEMWRPMGPVVAILSLAIIIQTAGGMTSTLFKAVGKPEIEMAVILSTSVFVLMPMIIAGAVLGGLTGVAIGTVIAKVIAVIVRQVLIERILGGTAMRVLRIAGRLLVRQLPIGITWGAALALRPMPWIADVALLGLGLTIYALWELREEIRASIGWLKKVARGSRGSLAHERKA
jgi:O-antigen/teichoic acid export membrane protein